MQPRIPDKNTSIIFTKIGSFAWSSCDEETFGNLLAAVESTPSKVQMKRKLVLRRQDRGPGPPLSYLGKMSRT